MARRDGNSLSVGTPADGGTGNSDGHGGGNNGDAGSGAGPGGGFGQGGHADGSGGPDGGGSGGPGGTDGGGAAYGGSGGGSGSAGGTSSGGVSGAIGGCFNIETDPAAFDSTNTAFMAQVALELTGYLAGLQNGTPYPGGDALKAEVAKLWGMVEWPYGTDIRCHHLMGQHLVDGRYYAQNEEHYKTYEALYNCPLLCVPLLHRDHVGPGSVHSLYGPTADIQGVPQPNGIWAGLAALSPEAYMNVSLTAFREATPEIYKSWCKIVWSEYYKV